MKTQRRWAAVVLWMLLIFTLSSIPGEHIPTVKPFGIDKLAHCIEYFILAFLWMRALSASYPNQSMMKLIILSIAIAALYGAIDEIYQRFIPNRIPDFFDFAFDSIGATIGAITYRRR